MDTSFRIDEQVTTAEVPVSGYTYSQVVKRIIFGDCGLFGITFD